MTHRVPLILLPGLLCDAALWSFQTRHLEDVCQPRVMDLTRHETMAHLARSVLEEAPPRFALAGLSMGGYVAMEIIRQDPSRVIALGLFNTSARPDTEEKTAQRLQSIEAVQSGKFKGVSGQMLPVLVHEKRAHDREFAEEMGKMAQRVGQEAFVRQQLAIMSRPDSRGDLARFKAPSLVVGGRQDKLTPLDCAKEMAEILPNAAYAIIEECGHMSPMEQPESVTAIMRLWLTGQLAPMAKAGL